MRWGLFIDFADWAIFCDISDISFSVVIFWPLFAWVVKANSLSIEGFANDRWSFVAISLVDFSSLVLNTLWWWGDWESVFCKSCLAAGMGMAYKPLLVVLNGISSPRNPIVSVFKSSGMSESILFVLMLTLCWSIWAGMMAAIDETNCSPSPNQDGLMLSSTRTFDLSSFERLSTYSSNHGLPQTVLVA